MLRMLVATGFLLTLALISVVSCADDPESASVESRPTARATTMNAVTETAGRTIITPAGNFIIREAVLSPVNGSISASTLEIVVAPEDGEAATTEDLRDQLLLTEAVILSAGDGTTRPASGVMVEEDEIRLTYEVQTFLDSYELVWPGNDPIQLDSLITR